MEARCCERRLDEFDARFLRVHHVLMINGVLLDLAGVVYDGDEILPGSAEAVARLRDTGLPIRFVSNTTRSSRQTIVERLNEAGLSIASGELFTPAQAACKWLQQHDQSPYLLVHPDLISEFHGLDGKPGKALVIGDAGEIFDYSMLNRAFRELIEGADFLALASNRTFKDADGKLSLDAGAFVTALEFASRKSAIVLGKPSTAFFESALASMHCSKAQAVMIGDDAEVDVAGALLSGISYALLVRTGKYRDGDEERFNPPPTATVADLSAAAEWIIAGRHD